MFFGARDSFGTFSFQAFGAGGSHPVFLEGAADNDNGGRLDPLALPALGLQLNLSGGP